MSIPPYIGISATYCWISNKLYPGFLVPCLADTPITPATITCFYAKLQFIPIAYWNCDSIHFLLNFILIRRYQTQKIIHQT